MPEELNKENVKRLTTEIKNLQERCLDTYNTIKNSPIDAVISANNIDDKALNYVLGLREEIQNSTTPIINDDNLIISQFLFECKERIKQVEELIALTVGTISEIDSEIHRLESQNNIVNQALSRPKPIHQSESSEYILKAKETFKILKTEIYGVIQSFFPNSKSDIIDIMAQLTRGRLYEKSNGYVQITDDNYIIVALLREMNIISMNPYNNAECKIAY